MIKTIRNLLVLSACIILLLLSGCRTTGISMSQMKEDVISHDVIQHCYHSDYTYESPYYMVDLSIVKEQNNSESKEIITYSDAKIKNDFFEIELSIQTVYNYYDKGGWVLDELSIEEINNVTPVRGPLEDLTSSFILNFEDDNVMHSYFLDDPETEIWLFDFDESGTYSIQETILRDDHSSAEIRAQYNSVVATFYGYFVFDFFPETGWTCEEPKLCIEEWKTDFSAALGDFVAIDNIYTQSDYFSEPDLSLSIISINDNIITYSIHGDSNTMPGNYKTGDNLTAECKISREYGLSFKFGEFELPITGDTYAMWFSYEPENDIWTYSPYEFARK